MSMGARFFWYVYGISNGAGSRRKKLIEILLRTSVVWGASKV
jgi:hypothetical protein